MGISLFLRKYSYHSVYTKLERYKIFPNIFETIRYKIIYLQVGIFDSDTKKILTVFN